MLVGQGYTDAFLSEKDIRELVTQALSTLDLDGKRIIVILPDSTRTAPIPAMFSLLDEMLGARAAALDFLVALGTHPPHER